jgi:hypothetical protein
LAVHLEESEFVSKLANNHQAAPCEYQILAALKEKINAEPRGEAALGMKKIASRVLKGIVGASREQPSFILGIDSQASRDDPHQFYSEVESSSSQSRNIVVLLDVGKQVTQRDENPRKIYRAFVNAAEKVNTPFLKQSFVSKDCQDYEAASIIALQHLCCQNRMFVEESQPSSKRKRSYSN